MLSGEFSVPRDYAAVERLHRGTRSVVWRARRKRDGRAVILKAAVAERPTPSEYARIAAEYETARHIHDGSVVAVIDLVQTDRGPVLVLEDFGGAALDRQHMGPWAVGDVLAIGARVADALAVLHAAGIAHRDVNPSNIIRNPDTGEVKLTDLASASATTDDDEWPAVQPDLTLESLRYAAPEQTWYTDRPVDHRTDLYSLGVTLYELLCGSVPFAAANAADLARCHALETPPSVLALAPDVPGPLVDLVASLMAKEPEMRFPSTAMLRDTLAEYRRQWQETGTIEAMPNPLLLAARQAAAERQARAEELLAARSATRADDPGPQVLGRPAAVGPRVGPDDAARKAMAEELLAARHPRSDDAPPEEPAPMRAEWQIKVGPDDAARKAMAEELLAARHPRHDADVEDPPQAADPVEYALDKPVKLGPDDPARRAMIEEILAARQPHAAAESVQPMLAEPALEQEVFHYTKAPVFDDDEEKRARAEQILADREARAEATRAARMTRAEELLAGRPRSDKDPVDGRMGYKLAAERPALEGAAARVYFDPDDALVTAEYPRIHVEEEPEGTDVELRVPSTIGDLPPPRAVPGYLNEPAPQENPLDTAMFALAASRQAQEAHDYTKAREQATRGIAALPANAFDSHYELAFGLHYALCEAACALDDALDDIEDMCHALSERARTRLERTMISTLEVWQLGTRGHPRQAVDIGLGALEDLGIDVRNKAADTLSTGLWTRISSLVGQRSIEQLVDDLPSTRDPDMVAAMELFMALGYPLWVLDPEKMSVLSLYMAHSTLASGTTPAGGLALASGGIAVAHQIGDVARGEEFGRAGIRLAERLGQYVEETRQLVAEFLDQPASFTGAGFGTGTNVGVDSIAASPPAAAWAGEATASTDSQEGPRGWYQRALQVCDAVRGETEEAAWARLVEIPSLMERLEQYKVTEPTFAARYHIVCGEVARVYNEYVAAEAHYEYAISQAREYAQKYEEARANELAGCFFRDRSMRTPARAYLEEAHACYLAAGAMAKAAGMEGLYAGLWQPAPLPRAAAAAPATGKVERAEKPEAAAKPVKPAAAKPAAKPAKPAVKPDKPAAKPDKPAAKKRARKAPSPAKADRAAKPAEKATSASELTRESIRVALARRDHVVSRAAKDLGVTRQALYRRMQKLGIDSARKD